MIMKLFGFGRHSLLYIFLIKFLLLKKARTFTTQPSLLFLGLGSFSTSYNPQDNPTLTPPQVHLTGRFLQRCSLLTRFVGGPVETQLQQHERGKHVVQQKIVPTKYHQESHHPITINYNNNNNRNDNYDDFFHLTDSQIRSLPSNQRFKYRLKQLSIYYNRYGTFSVTKKENKGLANWVYRQRYEYRQYISHNGDPHNTLLTPERIQALDQIGFDWRSNGSDTTWFRMYHRLEQYHDEHGHIFISSREDKELYKFLANQRQYYSNLQKNRKEDQQISQERIAKLEKLGMVWNLRSARQTKYDLQWNAKLKEVVEIQRQQQVQCDDAATGDTSAKMQFPLPHEYHSLNVWLYQQRLKYKERQVYNVSSLTFEREEALRRIGFDFEDFDDNNEYSQYEDNAKQNPPKTLREQYQFGSLSWLQKYEELKSYSHENNHTLVHTHTPLGKWVREQRNEYKKYLCLQQTHNFTIASTNTSTPNPHKQITTTMTLQRVQALEGINFCWDVHEMKWMNNYEALRLYYQKHNHTRVPKNWKDHPTLPYWVSKQRKLYGKSIAANQNNSSTLAASDDQFAFIKKQLSEKRIKLLNDIHFFEDEYQSKDRNTKRTRKKKELSWMQRYEELEEFHKEHGHCRVPKRTHSRLSSWVNNNRREYKLYKQNQPSQMTVDRVKALERIAGFDSNATALDVKWNQNFEKLKSFYEEYGHSRVPLRYSKQPELGRWVNRQRAQYKKVNKDGGEGKVSCSPSLTLEHIGKLESIGFEWEVGRGRGVRSINKEGSPHE